MNDLFASLDEKTLLSNFSSETPAAHPTGTCSQLRRSLSPGSAHCDTRIKSGQTPLETSTSSDTV